MQATIIKTLDSAVRVILVEEDAEWKAEFEEYGYDTDMWASYGMWEEEWRDNVAVTHTLNDETYGFMCGASSDRRCYGFTVDVHRAEEADGNFSFWISEEDYEKIG
jgi:hypothetical protein